MLRFFRTIRQKLIEQENIRKYIWYALGEILLVMVGILLALQVNNWNEGRKNRNYELKILNEVHTAVQADIEMITWDLGNLGRSERSAVILTRYKNGETNRPDSILQHIDNINIRRFFRANDGPYEAIKSGGLDRISNDTLRTKLSEVYDDIMPGTSYMYNDVLSIYINSTQDIIRDLFNGKMTVGNDDVLSLHIDPPTPAQVSDPRFDLLLQNSFIIQSYGGRNLERALRSLKELEKILSDELQYSGAQE